MSQKQKTPKKSSALDALSITDDALSQTVDTDLEIGTGSSKKKTPSKNALRRRIHVNKEGEATPARNTNSQEQDEDIDATPKRKDTPAAKKKSKKSGGVQKKQGRSVGRSVTKSKIITAEGEFTESEIKAFDLMRRSDFILPRASFLRLLKEVIRSMQPDFRIARDAVDLIQTVVEDKLTDVFFVGNTLALSRKQATVNAGDIRMAALIRGVSGSGLHMHTTHDLKKVLQGYGWKREELTQGNVGPDLIAQQGMLKLEMLSKESNKKKGIESKPKKTTDDNDEDYVRKTNKRKKTQTTSDDEDKSDNSDSDDEKPKKKAKKSAKKAEKKKQTEEDASDSEQEY